MKKTEAEIGTQPKLSVLIIDDHYLHRCGLKTLLKNNFEVSKVDESDNGVTAIDLMRKNAYEVVFLDIEVPIVNGLEICKIFKREFPKSNLVVMTGINKKYYIYDLIEIGVNGYLPKNYPPVKMKSALESILKGGKYIASEIDRTYKELKKSKVKDFHIENVELSNKEKKIVMLMCEQLTSGQISAKLGISKTTVDTHRKRIFKKLNIVNSIGIALYAFRSGLYVP